MKILKLLEKTVLKIHEDIVFVFKPHPNFMIKASDFPSLDLEILERPLVTLLDTFNIAYTGNMTSAAVDAYISNLQVIVHIDENKLN